MAPTPTTTLNPLLQVSVNKLPYAIALLRGGMTELKDLSKIKLERNRPLKLNSDIERIIQENIINMIVYRPDVRVRTCGLFERLAPEYKGKQRYVLTDYSLQQEDEENINPKLLLILTDAENVQLRAMRETNPRVQDRALHLHSRAPLLHRVKPQQQQEKAKAHNAEFLHEM